MSANKLAVLIFSGFLVVATGPFAAAQDPHSKKAGHDSKASMSEIRQMQQALADLQYNPGPANGKMTSQTRQAIREFQWLNDMPVTGNLDAQTTIAINMQERGEYQSAKLSPSSYSSSTQRQKPQATSTKTEKESNKESKDGVDRVEKSVEVLQDLTSAADKRIPNELLERAEAIVVIPHMIKGAFGLGGRYGKGVVSERTAGGRWSPPAFVEVGGGSFGAQIGVSATDLVLVFTDRKAVDLLEDKKDVKLGVDAGVAAGPIGRSAEAGVNLKLDTAIYAYSRSKGLFAGVALDGAVLDIDHSMNEKVYGASANTKAILNGSVTANSTVRPFMDALEKVMPKKRVSKK
jgi:lipid-binding SYLF domain-containing protein